MQIKTGPSALSPEAIDTESLEGSGGEQLRGVDNSEAIFEAPFEEDPFEHLFGDLQSEDDILQRCKELETKVEGLRAKQAKMAEDKKKALKEVKDKAKAVAKAVANAKDGAPGGKERPGGGPCRRGAPARTTRRPRRARSVRMRTVSR